MLYYSLSPVFWVGKGSHHFCPNATIAKGSSTNFPSNIKRIQANYFTLGFTYHLKQNLETIVNSSPDYHTYIKTFIVLDKM